MDTILQAFLSWQFLAFALAIGAVVFVIRQLVEYWMSNWWPLKNWTAANKEAKLWRGLILPVLPVLLGQVGGLLAKNYPYPEGFHETSGRIAFGLVAGFTSGMFVRLYRSFLASKTAEFSEKVSSFIKPKKNNEECEPDVSSEDVSKRGQP
jgi:hypothetical protein